MRKTWAEYKKQSRNRQREKQISQERVLNNTLFSHAFSEYLNNRGRGGYGIQYLILGKCWWNFENDAGIDPHDTAELDQAELEAASNSLGKAELILDVMESIVETLSQDIADYKRDQIEARISTIQKSDLTGPDAGPFLDELESLKKMRHRLNKRVRKNLPQTRASG